MRERSKVHPAITWAALGCAVFALYAVTGTFDFISYDDPVYVTANRRIASGITVGGLRWAMTGVGETNLWHPLTWMSHMADVTLFGTGRPGMHHLVNAAWHALAAVGFGRVLERLTGRHWLALGLAALWAAHPQRVQSVAWISERKDVLSGALFFASWWAWENWRSTAKERWYGAAVAGFLLAALAKPSVVPLPLVLACREWMVCGWRRLAVGALARRLAPMLAISVLAAALTIHFQKAGGLGDLGSTVMPLGKRLVLMPVSAWWYLRQWVFPWPGKLWVYPPEGGLSELALPLVGLAGGAFVVALWWRRSSLIGIGAGAFVLLWLPVSGIVPVSFYHVADRYSYLVHAGLFITLAGVLEISRNHIRVAAPAVLAVAAAVVTWGRLAYWKNSGTLFAREREINPRSLLAPIHLGVEMEKGGDFGGALGLFGEAMRIDSSSGLAATGAARALEKLGRRAEALLAYREAGRKPLLHSPEPFIRGAAAAMEAGDSGQARSFLEEGMVRFPGHPALCVNLGALDQQTGSPSGALKWYERALAAEPGNADAMQGKGVALIELGRETEGLEVLTRLLESEPGREAVARFVAGKRQIRGSSGADTPPAH